MKKDMTDSGIRARHLRLPNCGDTPHICIIQDTNSPADDYARHGQNQKKEKKLRLLN